MSMNSRKQLFGKLEKLPGPTEYNPKASFIHSSEFTHTIQKSQRPNIVKHLEKIPGPGEYEASEEQGHKFKFSKQKRAELFASKFSK